MSVRHPTRRQTVASRLGQLSDDRQRTAPNSSPSAPPPSATSPWPSPRSRPFGRPPRRLPRPNAAAAPCLLAFGLWLRKSLGIHALIHVGAHGTLEWLPGKTVALSEPAFPKSSPARCPSSIPSSSPIPAKQRKPSGASPPSRSAICRRRWPAPGWTRTSSKLERLVDEYAQADGLDRRRRDRLAKLIVETARKTGLAAEAGVARTDAPDEALRRIDAWLCDLKDFAIKDGLHIYGRAAEDEADPLRRQSAAAEKQRCSPRSTAATSGRAGRRAGARPCRRAADRPQPVHLRPAHHADADRLRSRPARRPRKWCAATCRTMATGRARWSSTCGARRRCAPAARRSRRAWR